MRVRLIIAAAIAVFSCQTPAARGQVDEKTMEANILKEWDAFEHRLVKARKELATLQLQYNSVTTDKGRAAVKRGFELARGVLVKRADRLWMAVDNFLKRHPKNVPVRERRMNDLSVFDQMLPSMKAHDAEKLYEITGDGRYIQDAAKWWGKAYDFKNSMRMWQLAADKAPTYEVLTNLGTAAMNNGDYRAAQVAFNRAQTVATQTRKKQQAERNSRIAEKYIRFWENEKLLREKAEKEKNLPLVEIVTERGTIVCELFEDEAPNTVANFVELVERGFYDGLTFHRNIPQFMIQGGDPDGTGNGGPGYYIKDEQQLPNARRHFVGSLGMANLQRPNTGGSQFYITSVTAYWLNGPHTVFGRVIKGIDVTHVQPIDPKNPQSQAPVFKILKMRMLRKRDHPYKSVKIGL